MVHLRVWAMALRHMEPDLSYVGEISYLKAGMVSVSLLGTMLVTGMDKLVWAPAGIMFIALLVLMSGEMLTEYYGMTKQERVAFVWEREITGKFLLLALVALSLILDMVIYVAVMVLPGEFPIIGGGYLFVTFTTMLWLIAAEVTRITRNIAHSEGAEAIPPTLNVLVKQMRWILKSLRLIDAKRAEVAGVEIKEESRWYDTLTEAEIEDLARFMEARQKMKADPVIPKGIIAKEGGGHDG